jgi:hypothetical protein
MNTDLEKFIELYESKSISNLRKKDPHLFQEIITITSFLNSLTNVSHRQRLWHIVNNIYEIPKCSTCNGTSKWRGELRNYAEFCSVKCAAASPKIKEKRKETCIKKYGVESFSKTEEFKNRTITEEEIEKAKKERVKSNIKKYGVESTFEIEEIKEKIEKTNLERYGFRNVRQSPIIIQKIKNTIQEKYNVDHYNETKEYKDLMENLHSNEEWVQENVKKQHETMIKKYGVINHFYRKLDEYQLEKLNDLEWLEDEHLNKKRTITNIAKELNVDKKSLLLKMHNNNIPIQRWNFSTGEREIAEFLTSIGIDNIEQNNRKIIHPKEIDIYLPDYKFGIEYCGLFWHSELFKSKNDHLIKLNKCKDKEIKLITLFEDEWNDQKEKVKNKLKYFLNKNDEKKVYARNTHAIEINKKQREIFLNENHIQQDGNGSINLALISKNEIVAVIALIKSKNDLIINRYATNCNVIGGFSKLLSYIEKNFTFNNLITFADRRWSEGDLYLKTGFELENILSPDYEYIINNQRVHKFNFRHSKIKNKLESYDPSLSEHENMNNNNFYKIWNCGLLKFIKKK